MVERYSTVTLLKEYWNLLSEFKGKIILAVILTLLSVGLLVYAPKLLGRVVNSVLHFYLENKPFYIHESFDELLLISLIYIFGYLLKMAVVQIMAKVCEKATANLKYSLNEKLNCISPTSLNREVSGNLLARLNNDVANIRSFINKVVTVLLSDFFMIIAVILAAISMDAQLSLIFITVLPIYIIIVYVAHKITMDNYKSYQDILGHQMGVIGVFLPNRVMMNLFNSVGFLDEYFESLTSQQKEAFIKSRLYSDITNPISWFLTYVIQVLLYVVAGYMVIEGTISLGEFSTFVLYLQLFKKPFLSLTNTLNSLRIGFSSLNRVLEIFELPNDDNSNSIVLDRDRVVGEIEFRDVSYNNISNFNFKIQHGETINLVGEMKDCLIDLLLLFNRPDNGKILLDGEDISGYSLNSYRCIFGVSLEDDWIVTGSIIDNLSYGNVDAEMEEIVETCKFLGIHELIEKSPDGYDSYLVEDYHNFSDGEGKLICVARALIANPKILILNYPNYLSVEKLKTICEGKTAIILTPDETSIDFADKTINLDNI
ncbi:MAG: ABC transporter ATP-binding protein [Methanobrevibacter sp.]|nr:ABC transporter ATP-binding protein [Methanobrevibacter sp.]